MSDSQKKRILRAWYMYDWANSAYPLVISTALFPVYFSIVARDSVMGTTVTFAGKVWENASLYSLILSLSYALNAMFVPILSGIADWSGRKKTFLKIFCTLGACACALLGFFDRTTLWVGLCATGVASIGFNASLVFYNAFLPEIAPPKQHDRISATGFMMGYLGSSLLLIVILALLALPQLIGIVATGEQLFLQIAQWSFIAVAVWWRGFAEITFRGVPERHSQQMPALRQSVLHGFSQLRAALRVLQKESIVTFFLVGYIAASMGVQSVILLASVFGKQELRLAESTLIGVVLMVQYVAFAGSWLCAQLSERIGNTRALILITLVWMGACISAFNIHNAIEFALLSAGVGVVLGGIQSQMRSAYAKLVTHHPQHASLFSLYDIAEKIGTMAGMGLLSIVVAWTHSLRFGALALSSAFIVSAGILVLVHLRAQKHLRYRIITQPRFDP